MTADGAAYVLKKTPLQRAHTHCNTEQLMVLYHTNPTAAPLQYTACALKCKGNSCSASMQPLDKKWCCWHM
jgi:hypothetical protein